MRTLYLDLSMGAAGDMLTAALLELVPDKTAAVRELNSLEIPGVIFHAIKGEKCGIVGTRMKVMVDGVEEEAGHSHDHEHHHHDHDHDHDHDHHHNHDHAHSHSHRGITEIHDIVEKLPISDKVKSDILAVYGLIAEAESKAHGRPVTEIHFHEVGNLDAIADVTAVCLLMDKIGADKVVASPVHVGSGTVRCAHGVLPVPAPATASILNGVPIYSGNINSELCTPTGAALVKHFAKEFGEMPVMMTEKIGYGLGKKDFPQANVVRVFLGETRGSGSTVTELNFNVDDMTGEEVGFALECFMQAGALDAYTIPIGMKKSRPGLLISVMCSEDKATEMKELIFKHTTTIGLRETVSKRTILKREFETEDTRFGPVQKKVTFAEGIKKEKYEYEDLARIARAENISLREVKKALNILD